MGARTGARHHAASAAAISCVEDLADLNEPALQSLVRSHRERYDCDPGATWCLEAEAGVAPHDLIEQAEAILRTREIIRCSKRPGANPSIYIPGVQTATSTRLSADEVRLGMVAAHRNRPGREDVVSYVQATEIDRLESSVRVLWRRTNTELAGFWVEYDPDEMLGVSYVTPITDSPATADTDGGADSAQEDNPR